MAHEAGPLHFHAVLFQTGPLGEGSRCPQVAIWFLTGFRLKQIRSM